ncbi:MAG: nitrous oxide reductase family maturation protein NosD [Pseudomonadota bacterium]|nr:nitrous oxide reductase family maturation protein NosD [Pseudomonadota bacterium]
MILAWVSLALAQEHVAPAPPPVPVAAAPVPPGPPREVRALPGDDLAALVATLPAGSRVVLAAGEHPGPLAIDRALTLEGEPGAEVVGDGVGSVLIVAADDVTVRRLGVRHGGADSIRGDAGVVVTGDRALLEDLVVEDTYLGIDLRQVRDGAVRRCVVRGWGDRSMGLRGDGIRLWESTGIRIEGNVLDHVRDMVAWYSSGNVFSRNRVTHSRYGTHFMFADDNVVEDGVYLDDTVGIFVMYSQRLSIARNVVRGARGPAGFGIGLKEVGHVRVIGNRLLEDTVGLYLDGSPQAGELIVEGNLLAYDQIGVRLNGALPGARFSGNTFHENRVQVEDAQRGEGRGPTFVGNQWSSYVGYDLDRDGVGDYPYEVRARSGGLVQRRPVAAFFDGTLAAGILELVGRAFPMFRPPPLLVDPEPRVHR